MKLLELTLPATAGNLALDEVLLGNCESSDQPREVFRLWENPVPAVVLGRSSKVADEVNREFCQQHGIGYFRRSSGGAAVVIGPGCLMYAIVLDYRIRPELKMLDHAHRFVMQRMAAALSRCDLEVRFQGTCDLTVGDRKFSGNSLRCQRHCLLYHGTLLYDFPLDLVQHCLGTPPRQPAYRDGRSHSRFVTNLPLDRASLRAALQHVWVTDGQYEPVDERAIDQLAREKYCNRDWNNKL